MQTSSDFQIYQKVREAGKVITVSRVSDVKDIINTNGVLPELINVKIGNCTNRFLYTVLSNREKALHFLIHFDKHIVQIEL